MSQSNTKIPPFFRFLLLLIKALWSSWLSHIPFIYSFIFNISCRMNKKWGHVIAVLWLTLPTRRTAIPRLISLNSDNILYVHFTLVEGSISFIYTPNTLTSWTVILISSSCKFNCNITFHYECRRGVRTYWGWSFERERERSTKKTTQGVEILRPKRVRPSMRTPYRPLNNKNLIIKGKKKKHKKKERVMGLCVDNGWIRVNALKKTRGISKRVLSFSPFSF